MSNDSYVGTGRGIVVAVGLLIYGIINKDAVTITIGVLMCLPMTLLVKGMIESYQYRKELLNKYKKYLICYDFYGWLKKLVTPRPFVEYVLYEFKGYRYLQIIEDNMGYIPYKFQVDEINSDNASIKSKLITWNKDKYEDREYLHIYDEMAQQIQEDANGINN